MRPNILITVVVSVLVLVISILAILFFIIFFERPPTFWSENTTECRQDIDCTAIVRGCYSWEPINKKHKAFLREGEQAQSESEQSEFVQDPQDFESETANKQQRFTNVATICSSSVAPGPKPQAICQNNTCMLLKTGSTWLEKIRGYFWTKDIRY